MEEFKMQPNSSVRLLVKISSDAVVGSNVSVDEKIVKKSIQYSFSVDLGNSNDLNNSEVTTFSNFIVKTGNIDQIIESTTLRCTLKDGSSSKVYTGKTLKIDNSYFIALSNINLILA